LIILVKNGDDQYDEFYSLFLIVFVRKLAKKMDKEYIEELKVAFYHADLNKSGSIQTNELVILLRYKYSIFNKLHSSIQKIKLIMRTFSLSGKKDRV